jgi:hypothetical protein
MWLPFGGVLGAWRRLVLSRTRAIGAGVAVAAVAGLAMAAGRPAWAAAAVPADSLVVVSDPGVALQAPTDGRLRGDHLAATVTGVKFATHVGLGASAAQAAAGQRLVVFGLQGAHVGQNRDVDNNLAPPVVGTFIIDGQRRELPIPDHDDGTAPVYYRASVPASAAQVEVELAASGLAQTFSLTTGARLGVQPVVLYRDRVAWQPRVQVNGEQDLLTPDPVDGLAGATLPIRVHDVYLSWWGPDSVADVAPAPDQAWLVVDATSQDESQIGTGKYLHYLSGLTADQVTLTLPGGQTIASQLLNPGTAEHGVGVFDGLYDFAVPADVTTATLTVAPGNLRVTVAWSGSVPVTVATRGQATFLIAFPAVYQPPPPVAAAQPNSPAKPNTSQAVAQSGRSRSGGGISPAFPAGAAVLVAGAGAAVVLNRRRRDVLVAGGNVASPVPIPARPGGDTAAPEAKPAPDGTDATPTLRPPGFVSPATPPTAPTTTEYQPPPPTPAPALTPIPAEPAPPAAGTLYFEVLGPFRVSGWPDDQARSTPVVDLAIYLALHPQRPYSAEELRDPLSVGKPRALEADTIRTYANTLRRTVGPDHLPDAGRKGYSLSAVDTDWHRFVELSGHTNGDHDPAEQARRLAGALALVRGLPFSELPANGFGWVATELLISQVEVAITAAATRLVGMALSAGDWRLAAWASDKGLTVSPTAQDLNIALIRAAEQSQQRDRLAQAWRDVTRRYAAADEPIPDDLRQLQEELRSRGVPRPTVRPNTGSPAPSG